MKERVLVVAPHPDDEILGCGGTLLRLQQQGAELGWLIVTGVSEAAGWSPHYIQQREKQISEVTRMMGFLEVFNLGLPSTRLDTLPMSELVDQFSAVFKSFRPEQLFLPNPSDVHTDHRVVFDAATACTKWFRYPSVRRVLAYETLSETEFALAAAPQFHPNYFVDISAFMERKLEVMGIYASELGEFPFPRSVAALRALAAVRGAASGFAAAEAFQLLRERL